MLYLLIIIIIVSIKPIDRALSGATTPGQSGPGSDGNEGVLRILQSSSTVGTSPSDCLVSYPGHSLGGVLPPCRGAVSVFYSPSRLGNSMLACFLLPSFLDVYSLSMSSLGCKALCIIMGFLILRSIC